MLTAIIILFALAAVLGLAVAVQIFKKTTTSKGVAIAHGAVGAVGLIALVLHTVKNPNHLLTTAIVLLVIAALGGLTVFVNDLRGKVGPIALVGLHALMAVAAVVLVLVVALK
jgi:hypothetical protein